MSFRPVVRPVARAVARAVNSKTGFSPLELFAQGEQGVWYDPSDLTTLCQDAAGTIPVTTDGDPVGRMEDKSGNGNHATQTVAASRPVYQRGDSRGVVNLLLNTETLNTQNRTVTAVAHTLSFTGTGSVTLSDASTAGPLVGAGANDRVSLTFTPTAGSLTLTVSGSVTKAQLERGTATDYQRNDSHLGGVATGAATDLHWLQFDGVDDWMQLPIILDGDNILTCANYMYLSGVPSYVVGSNAGPFVAQRHAVGVIEEGVIRALTATTVVDIGDVISDRGAFLWHVNYLNGTYLVKDPAGNTSTGTAADNYGNPTENARLGTRPGAVFPHQFTLGGMVIVQSAQPVVGIEALHRYMRGKS